MALKCVFCGMAHLPSENCGRDTEAGLARAGRAPVLPVRLERARAVLRAVEERKDVPSALLAERRSGFDRAAWHKAYMKTYMKAYMRGWRARKKPGPTS